MLDAEWEAARLVRVRELMILDSAAEPSFERLSETMRRAFGVDRALVTVMDRDRLFVKSGFDAPRSLPREDAFCRFTVSEGRSIAACDLREDPRFREDPLVLGGPRFRFYAGAPITLEEDVVGTVCLLDAAPRIFRPDEEAQLAGFAEIAAELMAARRIRIEHERESRLLSSGPVVSVSWLTRPGWPMRGLPPNLILMLGFEGEAVALMAVDPFAFANLVHPEDRGSVASVLAEHKAASARREIEFDYRLVGAGGRVVWFRQFTASEPDEVGRVDEIRGVLIEQTEQKFLEGQISMALERTSVTLDAASLGAWDAHVPSGALNRNGKWASILGISGDELSGSLQSWRIGVHPLDRARFDQAWSDHVAGRVPVFDVECRMRRGDGGWAWVHSFGRAIERDAEGRAVRVAGTARDITEARENGARETRRKKLLDILNRAQRAFFVEQDVRAACELVLEPIIEVSESQFGFIGEMGVNKSGQQALLIRAISDISWDAQSAALYALHARDELSFAKLDNLFGLAVTEGRVVIANDVKGDPRRKGAPKGHPNLENFLGLPIRFGDETLGMIGLANRIGGYDDEMIALLDALPSTLGVLMRARRIEDERRRAQAELERLAAHDHLTGLNNRRSFLALSEQALASAAERGAEVWLAMVDLDHFKRVNDTFGHAAGDEVLRMFAVEIRNALRSDDVIGRLGGEEFAALLLGADERGALEALERLRRAVAARTVDVDGHAVTVTASIGVTRVEADAHDLDAALAVADAAVYAAKHGGRNRVVWRRQGDIDLEDAAQDVLAETLLVASGVRASR